MGVTGVRKEINTDIAATTEKIREVTTTPVCVGFGISTKEQAAQMAKDADGAIIGSAIVKIIGKYGKKSDEKLKEYLTEIAKAVHSVK
jgi:tryptophan synthase alpha chain